MRRTLRILVLAGMAILGAEFSVGAGEPRPWLCRDKPVFSSERQMTYEVTTRGSQQWQLFFMQFSPGAAHDGFSISHSQRVGAGHNTGKLPPGRYFAVPLYSQGSGVWVCPGYSREADRQAGMVTNLCYGESAPACPISLSVKADESGPGASPPSSMAP